MHGLAIQDLSLLTPVPPFNWPISPGGAGSPGPTLAFALQFLPDPRECRQSSFPVFCVLCIS